MPNGDDMLRLQLLQQKIRDGQVLEGVRRMIALLNEARRGIVADVMETDWQRFYLPRLRTSIERHLEQWRTLALKDLSGDQATNWEQGSADVNRLFTQMNVRVALPELPTSLLQSLQDKGARTLRGLANFAKDQIDRTIALSLITGESREATIDRIGRHLEYGTGEGKPQGKFATIAARAKFIYEHEVSAAYADAKYRRFAQSAQYAPGLKKVWLHQGHPRVPRPDHIAMHGQVRHPDEDFTNPQTGAQLAFPRDRSADIGETAGCTCTFVGWRDAFGDLADYIGPATTAARRAA
ncbi:MAG: hypothetical protein H8K10_15490 [Nitrospira sp.]|nr:hypothetical protein [Nitrospira sp.]